MRLSQLPVLRLMLMMMARIRHMGMDTMVAASKTDADDDCRHQTQLSVL